MSGYQDFVGSWVIEDALTRIERAEQEKLAAADRLDGAELHLLEMVGWVPRVLGGATVFDHPRTNAHGFARALAVRQAVEAVRMVLRQPKAKPEEPRPAEINENLISCQEAD